jgi:hypothetical protein
MYDRAKFGSQHLLTGYVIGVPTFRVAIEKIRGVIGLRIEAALRGAAQTAFRAAENAAVAFFPKESMFGWPVAGEAAAPGAL